MKINLDKNKKYLLACSFGTDSMTLFDILLKQGYNFIVAHVNYNLREDSSKETESLINHCKENNIQIFVLNYDKFLEKGNIENECRQIRYNFFKQVYQSEKVDALLVAHQQDDHIETYLLQKDRNIVASFYGLSYQREIYEMNTIRPMLDIPKSQINKYLKDNNVPHSIDCTNLIDCYERNKIRHNIVEKLSLDERYKILKEIDEKNANNIKKLAKLKDLNLNSVNTLLSLDDEEFQLAVYLLINKISYSGSISKKHILEIRTALTSTKPNLVFVLNNAIRLAKSYDEVILSPLSSIKKGEDDFLYVVKEPSILDTPYFYLDTTKDVTNRNITPSDYPLTIRNARLSDTFKIKDYYVKYRRAAIDWKIPSYLRNRWPVIFNKDGEIIYVPRYQKDFELPDDANFFVKITF